MPEIRPDTVISGKAFKESLVYIWKRGDVVLYVGMSKVGFRRIFGPHDHLRDVEETDTIEVYYTPEPFELEKYFIKLYKPLFNLRDYEKAPTSKELESAVRDIVEEAKAEL